MLILFQPFKTLFKVYRKINSIGKFNYLNNKKLLLLIISGLILSIYSCGLLDSGGGMNPIPESSVNKIYSINSDGSNLKLLSNGSEFHPSITGDTIFYLNNGGIYSMNLDGTNQHLITPPGFSCYNFWLSFDGKKLCTGEYFNPYVLNSDGSGLTKLNLPDSIKYLYGWAISPSGNKIAFSYIHGLYLIDYDGENLKHLRDSTNSTTYTIVNFTPDDSSFIYIENAYMHNMNYTTLKLYKFKDSSDKYLVTENVINDAIFYNISQWNTILFTNVSGIYLFDLSNNNLSFLTKGSYAHYSIDGSRVSYIVLDSMSLYTYNLKSRTINKLNLTLPGNSLSDSFLSRDNSKIIFLADSSYTVKNN
jgi:hypothetical protein